MCGWFYKPVPILFSLTLWLLGFPTWAQKLPYCYFKAQAALWENDIATAQQWTDSCVQLIKPIRYQYALLKGETYLKAGDPDKAIDFFLKAESFRKGIASFWLAKSYCIKGDTLSCINWTRNNLESVYKEPESKYLLDNDFSAAFKHKLWAELWKKDWYTPVEKDIHYANYLINAGQFDEAIELLGKRIKGAKSRATLFELRGMAHYGERNYQLALYDFEKAYRKSKRNHSYNALQAKCLLKLEQNKKALKQIEAALQKSGGQPQYLLTKVQILIQLKLWNEAYSTIKTYLDFYHHDPNANLLLIECAYEAGYYADALLAIAKQQKFTPNQPDILLTRGKIYLKTSQAQQAIQDFDALILMDYHVAEAYYLKGLAHLQLMEKEEACRCFSISALKNFFKAQELLNTTCKR